jgi:hypothetical protein
VTDALGRGYGSNFDFPAGTRSLLYVRDRDASRDDLKLAALNYVGARADAEVYRDIFRQVDSLGSGSPLINLRFGRLQSDARAVFAAQKTKVGQFARGLLNSSLKTFESVYDYNERQIAAGRYWAMDPEAMQGAAAGAGLASIIDGYAQNYSFATDPYAPADLRRDARVSLFVDAALTFGPFAAGAALKGAAAVKNAYQARRAYTALNGFRTESELNEALEIVVDTERRAARSAADIRFNLDAEVGPPISGMRLTDYRLYEKAIVEGLVPKGARTQVVESGYGPTAKFFGDDGLPQVGSGTRLVMSEDGFAAIFSRSDDLETGLMGMASRRNDTLVLDEFTIATPRGSTSLVGPAQDLLKYAQGIGANSVQFRGTIVNPKLIQKFGSDNRVFDVTAPATRDGIVDALNRLKN